jgi:hypothetical protein
MICDQSRDARVGKGSPGYEKAADGAIQHLAALGARQDRRDRRGRGLSWSMSSKSAGRPGNLGRLTLDPVPAQQTDSRKANCFP